MTPDPDRLFRDFFRSQLPARWPAAPTVVVASPTPRTPAGSPARSRLTLAASAAALLGLGLTLAPAPQSPPTANAPTTAGTGLLKGSTASGAGLLKAAPPQPMPAAKP